ncbi:MAG: TonB-dependent receptor [Saprospiraceae bacterium]
MNYKSLSILMLCLLGQLGSIQAQDQEKIYGIVTNENSELLIGASVFWEDTKQGTTTDLEGQFWVPARTTKGQLIVQYVGHTPANVEVLPGEDSLWIEVQGVTLQEVTIAEKNFDNGVSMLETRNIERINSDELKKAPCCNLSESFETNGTVDLVYANALTGIKEIQMLGLRGVYSQFMVENRPSMMGIATPFAFEMIPGTWLSGIQLAKGASTVKNGYSGISGQINADLVKPQSDKPFYLNAYSSSGGRGELNVHLNKKGDGNFSNGLLAHGSFVRNRWDMNNDNFYDNPNRYQANALYRMFYDDPKMCAQFNIQLITDNRTSGQIEAIPGSNLFLVDQQNDRIEVWGKLGRKSVFDKEYNQLGNMVSAAWHRANSVFGANTYVATQRSAYWQTLYETIIGNTNHKLTLAPSLHYFDIDEKVNEGDLSRTETIPGAMVEYSYNRPNPDLGFPDLVVVVGARTDYNSRFGWFFTPRFSAKYNFSENTIVRVSGGYGYRSPNLIAENISLLASNRSLDFASDISYEAAWNYGINFTQNFKLAGKSGALALDAYRTDFTRQIVVDVDQSPTTVFFYNSPGASYATNLLLSLNYNLLAGLDIKLVGKMNDVKATFANGELNELPLVARYRGLIAVDYQTPSKKWTFNTHVQLVGPQRLPDNSQVPHEYIHDFPERSPNYALVNLQITRSWKNIEFYLGGENLTHFMQHHAIIAVNEPWSPYFNGSQIWAPTMGAMGYLGVRFSPSGL